MPNIEKEKGTNHEVSSLLSNDRKTDMNDENSGEDDVGDDCKNKKRNVCSIVIDEPPLAR